MHRHKTKAQNLCRMEIEDDISYTIFHKLTTRMSPNYNVPISATTRK